MSDRTTDARDADAVPATRPLDSVERSHGEAPLIDVGRRQLASGRASVGAAPFDTLNAPFGGADGNRLTSAVAHRAVGTPAGFASVTAHGATLAIDASEDGWISSFGRSSLDAVAGARPGRSHCGSDGAGERSGDVPSVDGEPVRVADSNTVSMLDSLLQLSPRPDGTTPAGSSGTHRRHSR